MFPRMADHLIERATEMSKQKRITSLYEGYRCRKVGDGKGAPGYSVPPEPSGIVTPPKPTCNKPSSCQKTAFMGVDHGGTGRQVPPPESGVGDANANCPPKIFLSYRYKRSILWPSK